MIDLIFFLLFVIDSFPSLSQRIAVLASAHVTASGFHVENEKQLNSVKMLMISSDRLIFIESILLFFQTSRMQTLCCVSHFNYVLVVCLFFVYSFRFIFSLLVDRAECLFDKFISTV